MRRHAKASTAGSTQRQAGRLGCFFRGALATRASARGVKGSGAPSRGLFGVACLAILALGASFGGGAASASAAEECPNEIRRQEQGVFALRLPDCRAYENVSPGSQPVTQNGGRSLGVRTSISGDKVGYRSLYPAIGEEHSGQFYLSKRGPNGWVRRNVVPQESPESVSLMSCHPWVAFSEDLSKDALEQDLRFYEKFTPGQFYPEGLCNNSEQVLDPREPRGYRSVFVHDLASDAYELASLNEDEGPPGNSFYVAGSTDFSTIVFESEAQLTPEAQGVTPGVPDGFNIFVWSGGVVRLATILPDGTPVQGSLPSRVGAPESIEFAGDLADDGSKLVFEYGGALYVRYNPGQPQSAIVAGACTEPAKACTVQADESQGPGASGGGFFEFASADGSRVFFTSDHKMTPDSTAVAGAEDLYEFDTETGTLKDLTVDASEPAGVWAISDASADGSYVYFVAEAALEGSGATTPGDCAHYLEASTCNLYVRHNGVTTYIAAISVDDTPVYYGELLHGSVYDGHVMKHHSPNAQAAESSPNGLFFAFDSTKSIDGEGKGIYVYDDAADRLSCVTCGEGGEFTAGDHPGIDPVAHVSDNITVEAGGRRAALEWRRNQVLDDGSIFFTASGPLLAADTNGVEDVYRYKNGELTLISSGVDPSTSDFVEATPSGSDAFFVTAAGLVPSDTDGGVNLYDARIGGGFAEPPPLPGCEGEACRGAGTTSPGGGGAGTASFQGPGNQAQKHKADCGLNAKRAQKLAREAKSLRRRAKQAGSEAEAKRLRRQAAQLAKQGQSISKSAKRCRRANRGAGK